MGDLTVSLPSRERGLKYRHIPGYLKVALSLPSRERGLKSLCLRVPTGFHSCRSLRESAD